VRALVISIVPVLAVAPALLGAPACAQMRTAAELRLDFDRTTTFNAAVADNEGHDALLPKSATLMQASERNLMPSLNFGPFHASVGGLDGRHPSLGSYVLDTRDFWNSTISGSVDSRGAKVTFTLPLH
jgi:hypothetical protein